MTSRKEQLKLPDPRMEVLREHGQHKHDAAPRLDCAACRRFVFGRRKR